MTSPTAPTPPPPNITTFGGPHLNASASHSVMLDGGLSASPKVPPNISMLLIYSSTLPTIPSAVGTAAKFAKESFCASDGPPQGLAWNSVSSGQFGAAHKNASNPRIKSNASKTLPTILPTSPRILSI